MPRARIGFTLIELLVVISIIVVLLALLVPSMDQAIYQAELAVCATNHHSTAHGSIVYATSNKRRYPHRPGHSGTGANQPNHIRNADMRNPFDDRIIFRGYIPLKALVCPLTETVDLSEEASAADAGIWTSYYLWFGFQYNTLSSERGVLKLGDKLSFQGETFNVLTSPRDIAWIAQELTHNSHPDRKEGVMQSGSMQNEPGIAGLVGNQTLSWWSSGATHIRGKVDGNYGLDDGSVARFNDILHIDADPAKRDPRMTIVPGWANGMGWSEPVYAQLPRIK